MKYLQQWKRARARGVPLVAISTPDQNETIQVIRDNTNGDAPLVLWDIVRGFSALNVEGQAALGTILGEAMPEMATDAATALDMALRAPQTTVLVMLAGNRIIQEDGTGGSGAWRGIQAVSNLRDPFKADGRTLVLLGSTFSIPPELGSDVFQIDHSLPVEEEREVILKRLCKDAEITEYPEQIAQTVRATRGLSSFAVEQSAAISMSRDGFDVPTVRRWWKKTINNVPGLTIDESGFTMDDIVGLRNFKEFISKLMQGNERPGAVVRIDEIEKAMGGAETDSSGTSQDFLGQLLTFMQESNACGLIANGPAGSGKSLSSVAAGSAGGVPTITFDINATKGSLVGQSEKNAREAFRTISALAGSTLWIATCNRMEGLRPELRRRFDMGVWFFDLPDEEENLALRNFYCEKFGVENEWPDDMTGWTGAEIRAACRTAYRLRITPKEATAYISPVCLQAADEIELIRKRAENRFISASYAGMYQLPKRVAAAPSRRKVKLDE